MKKENSWITFIVLLIICTDLVLDDTHVIIEIASNLTLHPDHNQTHIKIWTSAPTGALKLNFPPF